MVNKRPLSDYTKPVHDEDCGIYRNDGMSALGENTVNKVMGLPRCTCGLNEARGRSPDETTIQCQYHYGTPTECRLIQLNHHPAAGQWQAPMWMCAPCRTHVRGLFRYAAVKT